MATENVKALELRKWIVIFTRVISYLVYFYLIVVEIILFIGFFLLLFGANPSAGFTEWAYRNLDRVMEPFRGIFTPIELGTTSGNVQSVFETSVLFAMIIYGIVAMALSALISWLSGRKQYLETAEEHAAYRAEQERLQAEIDARTASMSTAPMAPVVAPPAATPPPVPPPPGAPPAL